MPQVPLNLSCLPNSVIVSMRLPCKFDNVTASNSENNYTFINKVSCLSCITSQSELNWAKTILRDGHQPEVIYFFFFIFRLWFFPNVWTNDLYNSKELTRKANLVTSRCFKMKKTSLPLHVRRSKTPLVKLPNNAVYTHDSLLVSFRWYHGLSFA